MYTGLIAQRYAGALLEFACSNGEAEKAYAQAQELVKYFSSDKHIKAEIASPVIPSRMKQELICRGVNGICRSLEGFIALVIKQGREQFLLFMLHSFIQLYQQRNGIADVLLTTAAPIGKSIEGKVGELVRKNVDCRSVQVETAVDERLIGGFVLRIADRQMDSSVATQLAELERTLLGAL